MKHSKRPPVSPAAGASPPARIGARLVGSPCFVCGTTPRALERHDAALIALLAFEGPLPRARMAAWLWPDATQALARSHLRQRLLRLRRAAGAEWLAVGTTLRLADACTDLQTAVAALVDDPSSLRGELLAGLDYSDIDGLDDWVRTARERWRRTRLDVLSNEAAACEAGRRLVRALDFANRIVEEEPLQEVAHRRVMRLHYLRGDRSAALAAARNCTETLQRELGVVPDTETRALIATIETGTVAEPRPPPPLPPTLRRPPRLVAREPAWHALESAVASRAAVLVTGEAGLGKSRLLDDFARSRHDALVVAALAGDDRLPYATLANLLRAAFDRQGLPSIDWVVLELARLVPSLGTAPETPVQPLRLFGALEAEAGRWCADGLGVLVFDDLHFADAASLQALLPLIAKTTTASRLAWVLAARPAELPPEIDRWASQAAPRTLHRIALAPLEEGELSELLGSMPLRGLDAATVVPALFRHTGGNPFYVVETLIAWLHAARPDARDTATIPLPLAASVQTLIRRQLDRLAPVPLRLARTMALAGQSFDEALAVEVIDEPGDAIDAAWEALDGAQILVRARLAHDLLRQGILDAIPPFAARQLHGRIASALDRRRETPPVRVADHWAAAGRLDRAAPRWVEAAHDADRAQRFVEAQRLFELAADAHAGAGQQREQHKALQELVSYCVRRQELGAAGRIAEQLTTLATDNDSRAWALERQCEIAILGRHEGLAETLARGALALGEQSGNGWIAFNTDKKLAIVLAYQGRHDEALERFETQRGWADEHADDRNAIVWRSDFAAVLDLADRHADTGIAFDEAMAAASAAKAWFVVYAVARNRALARHATGDLGGALAGWEEALRQTERVGEAFTLRNPRDAIRRAAAWRDAGHHGVALEWLEESRTTLATGDNLFWADLCDDQLAFGWLELGQPARAQALCASEPASGHVEARASRALVRARLARLQDRVSQVPVSFEAHCPRRLRLLLLLEASRGAATVDAALAEQHRIGREAAAHGLHGIALHASALAARSTLSAGRPHEAAALIGAVLDRSATLHPTGLTHAEMRAVAVEVLQDLGDAERATTVAARAAQELQARVEQVPAAFRRSFLDADPVRIALHAAAAGSR